METRNLLLMVVWLSVMLVQLLMLSLQLIIKLLFDEVDVGVAESVVVGAVVAVTKKL